MTIFQHSGASENVADVLIIGSGWAGSVAAYELTRNGYSCEILEARDLPGGRGRSAELDGAPVQYGTVWLTGSGSRMLSYIDRLGMSEGLVALAPLSMRVRTETGWDELDGGDPIRGLKTFVRNRRNRPRIVRGVRAGLAARKALRSGRGDQSAMSGFGYADEIAVSECFRVGGGFQSFLEFDLGWDPNRTSLAALLSSFVPVIEQTRHAEPMLYRMDGGTSSILARLTNGIPIRCGTTVTSVSERAGGAEVTFIRDGETSTVRSRAVVLATPGDVSLDIWNDAPREYRAFLSEVRYSSGDFAYFRTDKKYGIRGADGRPLTQEIVPSTRRGTPDCFGIVFMDEWVAGEGGLLLVGRAPAVPDADPRKATKRLQGLLEEAHPELRGHITGSLAVGADRFCPLFPPGRLTTVGEFRKRMSAQRIDLAGDYLGGPHSEGAVVSGAESAERVLRFLREDMPDADSWSTTAGS